MTAAKITTKIEMVETTELERSVASDLAADTITESNIEDLLDKRSDSDETTN